MTKQERQEYPGETKTRKQVIDEMNDDERFEKQDFNAKEEAEKEATAKAVFMIISEKVNSFFKRDLSN